MKRKLRKILIFHPALPPYRIDFFNRLTDFFSVKLILSRDNLLNQKFNQKALLEQLNHNVEVIILKPIISSSKGTDFYFGKTFFRIVSEKPDIILCSEFSPVTLEIVLLKALKLIKQPIMTVLDDSSEMAKTKLDRKLKKYFRLFALKILDGLIVLSEEVKQAYVNYKFPEKNIAIAPLVQDENSFMVKLREAVPVAKELFDYYQLKDKVVLLNIARHDSVKNLEFLIQAFKRLNCSKKTVLFMVGEGQLTSHLKKVAHESNVIFTGRMEGSKLKAFLLLSQLFILPSTNEAFGAVVNEALISGIPCLVSSKAGSSSLIESDLQGATFSPYDSDELTKLIGQHLKTTNPIYAVSDINVSPSIMPFAFNEAMRSSINLINDLSKNKYQSISVDDESDHYV